MRDILEDRDSGEDSGKVDGWTSPFGAMDFNQLREINECWHQLLHEDAEPGREEAGWLPLSDSFRHGSRCIVPLVNEAMLMEEGRRLEHCVAGYTHRCLIQPVHVASVRDESGRSCSTVEIHLVRKEYGWRPELVQHRGFRNRQPPPVCRRAVRAWLKKLEALDARHWADLEQTRTERHKKFIMRAPDPERMRRERRLLERVLPADAWQTIIARFEDKNISDQKVCPEEICEMV